MNLPEPCQIQGRGKGSKKNPDSAWKTGVLPARTLHSLILEDLFVKHIQAGFLTLGSSYSLRLPILPPSTCSGFTWWPLQVSSPNTAAGPSPIFP